MKTYRVYAESITDLYIDISANNEEEAIEQARETDGGEFSECEPVMFNGEFNVTSAEELTTNKKQNETTTNKCKSH